MNRFSVFIFVLIGIFARCHSLDYDVGTYTQVLDHFNWNINLTFEQRYLYSDIYWKNGPFVVYTGNEGDVEGYWASAGFAFEIAKELNGYILFIEHRYYGKSLPFGSESFDRDKIGYLSIEQAIADYALVIQHIKAKLGATDNPVIVLGGSYGGMLSAYFRFKYPNVVDAALAASAPIYLAAGLANNHSFWEVVTADFQAANEECPNRVKSAFIELHKLRDYGIAGLVEISEKFRLCKTLVSDEQVDHLIGWIRNAFAMMCMGDYPYASSFFGKLPANPVNVAAKLIMDAEDSLEGLVLGTGLFYNGTSNNTLTCFDPFTEYISCADPTGCGLGPNSLAWDYQACTELYLASGTNNVTDMFAPLAWTLEMREAYCQKTWGVTQRPGWFAISLWGNSISSASKIIFSNGALDPWKKGGVPNSLSDTLVALLIDGAAHHLDLRSSNPKDPPAVVAARKKELALLQEWISSKTGKDNNFIN